jgi:CubicO group peptidase (beta-lactamase class C family)
MMNVLRVVTVVIPCVAGLLLPLGLIAQVPPDAGIQVDRIFTPWNSVNSPGCAVGVSKDGLTIFSRGYGMADLEHDVPNTAGTIFEGGSLSKQFTAAAIMLLVMDGKLALDDDVRDYVPEVPDYGTTITLRHMMTHTSGLRDWGSVAQISGWGRGERSHDHSDVIDIVSRQSALNFEPGHEYSYSNTGYNLLAIIVGRVSGMSFAEFSEERIFEPLGLEHTQWRDDYRRIVKGRSAAYTALQGGAFQINRPIEYVHGNGGILTTVGDLLTWNQALTTGRLGGPEFVALMHETGRLNDGSEIVYAGGLQVTVSAGVPAISHTGSTAGYRAFTSRYPDQGLAVAMLCNVSNVPTGGTGTRIARVFLGEVPDPGEPTGVSVPRDELAALAGLYRDPVTGSTMSVDLAAGGLRVGDTPLIPLSNDQFQAGSSSRRYMFETQRGDRPTIHVESWQYTDQRFEPVEPADPSLAELRSYEGEYHSSDAETTFVVSVESGRLAVWQRPDVTRMLTPIYPDGFRAGGYIYRFRREGGGRVVALSLSLGRVYDMRFTRVNPD